MSSSLLDDLHSRFREAARVRVHEMAALLAALERDPHDAESLQGLAKHFHGLAGMGGTCGFPRVSELGDDVESEMLRLSRAGALPDAAVIARWKAITAAIARELESAAVSPFVGPPPPRMRHAPRRILAVEDDPTTGEVIRGFLGAAGYEVAICADAAEFEKTLFAFVPHLVLMDVQLASAVSGHDLVRYVRESEPFATLPVIIVTSDSQRRAMLESTRAGADLLVAKPIDWDMLLTQIAECLTPRT